jgi:acetoin utilization deacetylase AcuC-like enzyme
LPPGTTGDVWAESIIEAMSVAFDWYRPEAVVLQTGADPHFLDPLGHLMVTAQEWLEPVQWIHERGLPTVAAGGGGYEITAVPRMWAAATLTLMGRKIPEIDWSSLPEPWGLVAWWDEALPSPREVGREGAHRALALLRQRV